MPNQSIVGFRAPQAERVIGIRGTVPNIAIEVGAATIKSDRVFANKSLELRVVVSGAVEVEITSVQFPASVGKTIRRGRSAGRSVAKGLEGVRSLRCAG